MNRMHIPDSFWRLSVLRDADARARARLSEHAIPSRSVRGAVVQRHAPASGTRQDAVYFVLDGVLRTYVESDERQVTFRYATDGDVIGLCTMLHPGTLPISAQAVTDVEFAKVPTRILMDSALEHPAIADALLQEILAIQRNSVDHLSQNLFRPVRVRVAAHLLELSNVIGDSRPLEISHQVIADAIGTVREVASRAIAELTGSGAIGRTQHGMTLVDRAALEAICREG